MKLPRTKYLDSLLDHARQALEALRWRGPVAFLLLSTREIFKPVVYWHVFHILENDLTRDPPVPYGKNHFVARCYQGEEIAGIAHQLAALGELAGNEILLRAQRGDVVAVAYSGREPVGYSWMSRSSALPLAFNATWIMRADEAVLFGSFVRREWRGNGIHSWLDERLNAYARENGLVRTIGSMAVYNHQTLALAKHTNKSLLMTVALARIRGVDYTWAIGRGSSFASRFRLNGYSEANIVESFPGAAG